MYKKTSLMYIDKVILSMYVVGRLV